MNKVTLMGRLTKDVEVRTTPSEVVVAKFTIAVNRRFAKEGQQQADFINCLAFNKTAEFIGKYFSKGNLILVEGAIQTGSYEKDGQKVYTTEVLVDNAEFTGEKNNTENTSNQQTFDMPTQEVDEDELPF